MAGNAPKERKVREKSPVAVLIMYKFIKEMSIMAESVKKEKKILTIYEHFTINPRKLFPQPDKPTNNIMIQNTMVVHPNSSLSFSETKKSPELECK